MVTPINLRAFKASLFRGGAPLCAPAQADTEVRPYWVSLNTRKTYIAVACAKEEKSYNSYMIPYFYIDHFYLGSLEIHVWGFFVALGIITGALIAIKRAKIFNIKSGEIIDFVFWLTFGAFIGGRVLFVLINNGFSLGGVFERSGSGFSSLGAIVVGIIITFFIIRKRRILPSVFLQIFAPVFLLVEGVGRIGCFLIHEHLGRISNFYLAVRIGDASRHDLGLYFSISALFGFIIIIGLKKYQKIPTIAVGWLSIIWYFVARFLLEFLYENGGQFGVVKYAGLTLMQYISLFVILGVTSMIIIKIKKPRRW
jgi:phosphatidylglycerol:prolipoprotein diacylglycerol transferase